jgi:hypothetical protein
MLVAISGNGNRQEGLLEGRKKKTETEKRYKTALKLNTKSFLEETDTQMRGRRYLPAATQVGKKHHKTGKENMKPSAT